MSLLSRCTAAALAPKGYVKHACRRFCTRTDVCARERVRACVDMRARLCAWVDVPAGAGRGGGADENGAWLKSMNTPLTPPAGT